MRKNIVIFSCLIMQMLISFCNSAFIKTNTRAYLKSPSGFQMERIVDSKQLIVHNLSVQYDSSDLSNHEMSSGFRYSEASIRQLFNRFEIKHQKFYTELLSNSSSSNLGSIYLADLINASIIKKNSPFSDNNDYTDIRTINKLKLKKILYDSSFHLFPEITFRQDICIGCVFSGYGKEMHLVLHYRYVIVKGDQIVFYRELFIPQPVENIKKNLHQTDATIAFHERLENVLFYFLEKDFKTLFQ